MTMPRFLYLAAGVFCLLAAGDAFAADKQGKSPVDELPPHIRRVTWFGERADWSHDGKRILFLAKTFGDVYEVELATGVIRPMTHHYFHAGYTRALYLANGDILLSGAPTFDPKNPWKSRHEDQAELWVLKKDLLRPGRAVGRELLGGAGRLPPHDADRLDAAQRHAHWPKWSTRTASRSCPAARRSWTPRTCPSSAAWRRRTSARPRRRN